MSSLRIVASLVLALVIVGCVISRPERDLPSVSDPSVEVFALPGRVDSQDITQGQHITITRALPAGSKVNFEIQSTAPVGFQVFAGPYTLVSETKVVSKSGQIMVPALGVQGQSTFCVFRFSAESPSPSQITLSLKPVSNREQDPPNPLGGAADEPITEAPQTL